MVLACAGLACATSPTGRRQIMLVSDNQMDQMGVAAFDQLKANTPVSQDPAVGAYVRCVGDAIAGEVPDVASWEIVVFDDAAANAFALPGGKIGVYTGLLAVARNQSQLATVMGHEVGHVLARHSAERVSQQTASQLFLGASGAALCRSDDAAKRQSCAELLGLGAQVGVLMPWGRTQESEADVIGLDLMSRAGFDPRESIRLWQNMASAGGTSTPELLSTHPSHGTRIEHLEMGMGDAMASYEAAQAAGKRPGCSPP